LAEGVTLPLPAQIRVRYRHEGSPATVALDERGVRIDFEAPARAVTRGQIAVFYDGERVLGGGRITEAVTRARARSNMAS
jgi:tRNA-specific 2-thiouridylase